MYARYRYDTNIVYEYARGSVNFIIGAFAFFYISYPLKTSVFMFVAFYLSLIYNNYIIAVQIHKFCSLCIYINSIINNNVLV